MILGGPNSQPISNLFIYKLAWHILHGQLGYVTMLLRQWSKSKKLLFASVLFANCKLDYGIFNGWTADSAGFALQWVVFIFLKHYAKNCPGYCTVIPQRMSYCHTQPTVNALLGHRWCRSLLSLIFKFDRTTIICDCLKIRVFIE